jgi:deazaflavin-dependent oxidoreductase (nitroreductase family)
MADLTRALAKRASVFQDHLRRYLESGGEDGYLVDMSGAEPLPGSPVTTHLILRTYGRKTGRPYMNPLIYGPWGHEYLIVGSKGGHDVDPAWFSNLVAQTETQFQVRGARFAGAWSVLQGSERATAWDFLTRYYPSYSAYQARTERTIPVVRLTPQRCLSEAWSLTELER